jgi:type II secretory pathway pseudopilin PulG
MSANRAFTLIELMVAGALGLGLLALTLAFLVPSMRFFGQGSARVECQQQALTALNKAERDLQQTAMGGLSLFPQGSGLATDPVGMALLPLYDVDQDAHQLWQTRWTLVYWDRTRGNLYRKVLPSAALSQDKPTTLSQPQFVALCQDSGAPEQLLAGQVSHFDVLDPVAGPNVGQPLTLSLELLRKTAQSTTPERFRLERTVTLRNKTF